MEQNSLETESKMKMGLLHDKGKGWDINKF